MGAILTYPDPLPAQPKFPLGEMRCFPNIGQEPDCDHLIPIPGTRRAENLRDWVQAPDITLTPEDQAEIDRLLPPGFGAGDRYGDHQLLAIERYC